jgi:predicted DNA-binding transcriptional regulator YafY
MSINKLALIRYKTIDECLQNRFRKWTLEDLMDRVAEAIYDCEGITTGISKRTIQGDIQMMRSDKLGYNAPIIVIDKKYYAYEDKNYSIFKTPINATDVEKLKEVLNVLKQFNGFSYFGEMAETVVKLENTLYKSAKKSRNCIQFESNQRLKGIEHINTLYQAILHKKPLLLEYQSFKAKNPQQDIHYPYLLKEYRNRWFLITKRKRHASLMTLALDRIVSFQELSQEPFVEHKEVDFDSYYNDLLGVTKTEKDKAVKVILQINKENAPYILTKPLHQSQTVLKQDEQGAIISIEVVLNYELEREILGFGAGMKVLSPRILVSKIKARLQRASDLYANPSETLHKDDSGA